MATIPWAVIRHPHSVDTVLVLWSPIGDGDVGQPYIAPHRTDKTVQWNKATAYGGAVALKGTCLVGDAGDLAAAVWITLTDPQGNALSKSANDIETVQENVYALRPEGATGAAGVAVYLLMAGA